MTFIIFQLKNQLITQFGLLKAKANTDHVELEDGQLCFKSGDYQWLGGMA
jgi:hypothetical protein